ncbi:MAG: ankyrin repeat domain-containing protein [Planctomycetes bacterium]|nr:ankyrin repeat domain-containing protein [Planctomycetota bacterium]
MENTTKFFDAISNGDLSRVNSLLAENLSLASARNKDGISAILISLYQQQRNIAACLLAKKPELDIFDAAGTGEINKLRSLLDNDSTLANAQAADGARPLHLACFFSQTDAARLLLKHGAQTDIAVTAFGGVFALHSAAASRSTDIIQILLESGADPNTTQNGGWTALHAAAKHGDVAIATLLLEHGADQGIKTEDGTTARQLLSDDSPQAIRDLLDSGEVF